MYTVVIMKINM